MTRGGSETPLGNEVHNQFFSKPQPLFLASGVLVAMAMFPGLPKIPFLVLSGAVGAFAGCLQRNTAADEKVPAQAAPPPQKENLESLLRVDLLAVDVSLGLVRFVEGGQNSPLPRRIGNIRRQMAMDLGYLLPPIRVTDNLALKSREYTISLKGVEIARYELPQGCDLAIPPSKPSGQITGTPTREPAFGISALWISSDASDKVKASGYTVVDALSVLRTHLAEIVRKHSHELFSRQDAKKLLDRVADENPKVVEDLVPKLLSLAVMQRVSENLLRERVSIRDAVTILEALGEAAQVTRNPILLTEYVRQSIRRMVVKPYLNAAGELPAYFLDPTLEQMVESAVEHAERTSHLNLPPQSIRELVDRISRSSGMPESPVVVLTGSGSRYFLRQILETPVPHLHVLAHSEVPSGVKVISMGVLQ